jgi:Ca-activated chloride channel family protein
MSRITSSRCRVLLGWLLGAGLVLGGMTSRTEASAHSKNKEGNQLYEDKKYPEAVKKYTEAQLEAPDSPQLHYNLGNVFYRQGDVEKAREEYRRALAAADASLNPRTLYNLGNTFLSQQQYKEAVEAYQRTLKLAPKDMDAKRNLELALRQMKMQQKPPSAGKDQKKDQQKQDQNKPNPSSSPQDQKGNQGQKQDQKEPDQQNQQGKRPEKGGLTKEEAERILSALQEDEKANLKKRLEATKDKPQDVEKDW